MSIPGRSDERHCGNFNFIFGFDSVKTAVCPHGKGGTQNLCKCLTGKLEL